jgi:hypothetical protein
MKSATQEAGRRGPRLLHGLPITPKHLLEQLAGESFCVSFASPAQLDRAIELVDPEGMLMLDNGAFTHWRAGKGKVDREAFFEWANAAQERCAVAVAVIPDVIAGSEQENWLEAAHAIRGGLSEYPERLMFVWHMNDSLEQLRNACRLFNFVAIGSCAEYDIQKNRAAYMARLAHANAVIGYVEQEFGRRPWIHLMRANGVIVDAIRFDSSDSTNVARNHCRTKGQPNHVRTMADRVAAPVRAAAAAAKVSAACPTSNFLEGDLVDQVAGVELAEAA